jgi:hypothetical protein
MRGEGTPEEKLAALEEIPSKSNIEWTRRMREKQLEEEMFATKGKNRSELLTEFKKIQDIIEKTETADMVTGQQTVVPGFEVVNKGAKERLKQLTVQLFGDVQVPKEPETIGELIEQKRRERQETGTQLPHERKDDPTPEELRAENTREAYEKGKELGYWK